MHIELKNLEDARQLSEETTAYTATLWVDGKKAATCSNHGQGGSDDIHWEDDAVEAAVTAHMSTLPPVDSGIEGCPPLTMDIELFIADLIGKAEEEKQYRSWCKKGIVFQFEDATDKDNWNTLKTPDRARAVAYLAEKHPGRAYTILNDRFA